MTPLTDALTRALIASSWQDALIALILVITFAVLRPSAHARYVGGCIALAAMLVMPIVTATLRETPATPDAIVATAAPSAAIGPAVASDDSQVREHAIATAAGLDQWMLPIWCLGVIVGSLRLVGCGAHASHLRRRGVAAEASIERMVGSLAARMGIRRRVSVIVSSIDAGPATLGCWRSAIVLPSAVLGVPVDQLQAILAHELAHIRRYDALVNACQLLVETLCFYHPAVWWVSNRIREERELCCDDEVVNVCGGAIAYARALEFVARSTSTVRAPALGAAGGPLLRRVQRVLGLRPDRERPGSWLGAAAAMMVVSAAAVTPAWLGVQGADAIDSGGATLTVTLYDPFGMPAEHMLLVLSSQEGKSSFTTIRTDANGRWRFTGITPGRYLLTTPITDSILPFMVQVNAGEQMVDARLGLDPVAANIRVCRDCKDAWFKLPASIENGFTRDEQSAAIIASAEPAEGWTAFNERPRRYPAEMRRSTLEGTVVVDGVIAADGRSANLRVTSSPDPMLANAALTYVQQQRWTPAHVRSTPVEVPLNVTVEFSLDGN